MLSRIQKVSISYFHGVGLKPILYRTIGKQLEHTTQRHASALAMISMHQKKAFTYQELFQEVNRLAASFLALGLKRHDRIGIYSPNCYQWYLVQLAASMADLILVNINPAYQANELEYALNKVECKALVTATRFKSSEYLKILEEIAPEIKTSRSGSLNSIRLPHLKTLIKIDDEKTIGYYNFNEIMEFHESSHLMELNKIKGHIDPDDPTNIQFTSGTTGRPKGATLSHVNILNNGFFIGDRLHYNQGDRICVPVPLYHCFGLVLGNMAAITRGACVVYPSEGFNAKDSLKAASRFQCTSIYGVPTMFIEYLNELDKNKQETAQPTSSEAPKEQTKLNQKDLESYNSPHANLFQEPINQRFDLSRLHKGIVAGALCPRALMERLMKEMNLTELTNAYGMTETSPVTFQTSANDSFEKRVSTVGKVLPHVECKLVDDKGRTVPINTPGEYCVRGYVNMIKYWNDPESTMKTINSAGWLRSGDVGILDENGYLSIVGRIKDMIIRGGENVYPKEIEEYLMGFENVMDCQVFGVHDHKFGEEICVWLRLRDPKKEFDKKRVLEFCKGKIAHYKVPKYVMVVDLFPVTVTGKPQKFRMRDDMNLILKDEKNVELYKIR